MSLLRTAVLLVSFLIQIVSPAIGATPIVQTDDLWPLKDIDAFFRDPLANFDQIKKLKDPAERIALYLRWNRSVVKESLKTHFREIDGRKIEIIIFLLSHCLDYMIAEEAANIFGRYPNHFAKALEKNSDWKVIIEAASKSWETFSPGLVKLGNTEFEALIKNYALSLFQERERSLNIAEAFVHDPVAYYEKIKTIDDIGRWIFNYERKLEQEGRVNELPIRTLLENLDDIDDKKIEILIFLIINVRSGYQAEFIADKLAEVFKDHPQLFLRVLERMSEWKSVVDHLASWDPEGFEEGLEKAGESEFVKVIRNYLAGSQKEQQELSKDVYIDWDEVKRAFVAYESCPKEENARRLLAAIPEKPVAGELGNSEIAAGVIADSFMFDRAVVAGDELLAEAAFRLFGYMGGGAVDEELRIMLGRFLTTKPGIFLKLLKKYQHLFPTERDFPVTMTEIQEIVPDITSDEDELLMNKELIRLYTERIKALERVEYPELMELRDACIRVIKTIIAEIERRIP